MNAVQTAIVIAFVALFIIGLITVARAVRVVQQYERGVVFRFGRVRDGSRGPGLTLIVPAVDRLVKVNLQITTSAFPPRTASPATASPYASTRSSTSASSTRSERW